MPPSFRYADLFAGIGGFHAAMSAAGGELAYAVEIDGRAAEVYHKNWGTNPFGDITKDAPETGHLSSRVADHDVLTAGFPCQPFSKSGRQKGMDEARGTLFYNIAKIIDIKRPRVVVLENVRNIFGPRHRHEWHVIIRTLYDLGYQVSDRPAVLSPHYIPERSGGRPQIRERVFITATRADDIGGPELPHKVPALTELDAYRELVGGWSPELWHFKSFLDEQETDGTYSVTCDEEDCINAWDEFVQRFKQEFPNSRLPSFPIWSNYFDDFDNQIRSRSDVERVYRAYPDWKLSFVRKNADLYFQSEPWQSWCRAWRKKHPWQSWRKSWSKLEWQAGHPKSTSTPSSLWDCLLQFRPSGLRVKAPTYAPALVAITQTSIYGPYRRHITPSEAAALQGLPRSFSFFDQNDKDSYKQAGNGVNVGVIWNAMRLHCRRDQRLLGQTEVGKRIAESFINGPDDPTSIIEHSLVGRQLTNHRRL